MIYKIESEKEAKQLAKAYSYNNEHKDTAIYVIYCNRSERYYLDTNGLIRLWEQLIGYYINGVFTAEKAIL